MTATHTTCESVAITVPGGGTMTACQARPSAVEPIGAVIVGMELFGLSAHVREVCERLARHGYLAIAPNLYHRQFSKLDLAEDDHGRARGFALLRDVTRSRALADIAATMDQLRESQLRIAGMVGLSIGGHVAYLAAAHLGLSATVAVYPGWLPSTDIALSQPTPTVDDTPGITGRLLLVFGEADPLIPARQRAQIADTLTQSEVSHQLVEYPQLGHGFLNPHRASFNADAADDVWRRTIAFLDPGDQSPLLLSTEVGKTFPA